MTSRSQVLIFREQNKEHLEPELIWQGEVEHVPRVGEIIMPEAHEVYVVTRIVHDLEDSTIRILAHYKEATL